MNKGTFIRLNEYNKQNLELMKKELNNSKLINKHIFFSDFVNIALQNTFKDCVKRSFNNDNLEEENIEIDLKRLIEIFRKNNIF